MLNWKISKADYLVVRKIAERAHALAATHDVTYPMSDIEMDIEAAHLNGTPLRLAELAAAPEFDFAHDVFGIRRHLNRETGQLEDCFLPRFAVRAA